MILSRRARDVKYGQKFSQISDCSAPIDMIECHCQEGCEPQPLRGTPKVAEQGDAKWSAQTLPSEFSRVIGRGWFPRGSNDHPRRARWHGRSVNGASGRRHRGMAGSSASLGEDDPNEFREVWSTMLRRGHTEKLRSARIRKNFRKSLDKHRAIGYNNGTERGRGRAHTTSKGRGETHESQ